MSIETIQVSQSKWKHKRKISHTQHFYNYVSGLQKLSLSFLMLAVNMSSLRLEICFIKTNSFIIVVLVSLFTLDFQQVYEAQKIF